MAAHILLPRVFGDNMVWQRDRRAPVWGTAEPGRRITVQFLDRRATATVRPDGTFRAMLPAIPSGGPADMTITDGNDSIRLKNVVVGDVWVCSGQSNMEWPVSASKNPEAEIAAADFPQIRLFQVEKRADPEWTGDVDGEWEVCSPATVGRFSAVAYFMGRSLHRSSGVPIGLIHSSWGGTPAEAWVSREALGTSPVLRPILARLEGALATAQDPAARAAWEASQVGRVGGNLIDPGNKGFDQGFAGDEPPGEWKRVRLPGAMESLSPELNIDGAVWFRRAVDIPPGWAGKDLVLTLGAIDDFDDTYFNGTLVGRTTGAQPGWWQHVRQYTVPASLVRPGRNVVAVRVFDQILAGGLVGPADKMTLAPADGTGGSAISLAGDWTYRIEYGRPTPPNPPGGAGDPSLPTALFQGMFRPLIPFAIRGAAWYQGESNADRAEQYRTLLPALVRDWRRRWNQGDFPFLIVQLANFLPRDTEPGESEWAELREAQAMATRRVRNAALAVAIDIGEADDIHPRNKQDVGERLAMAARQLIPGLPGPKGLSPQYRSHVVREGRVRLTFTHAETLKTTDGGAPRGFAVAGADRRWVWAHARIVGNEIEVWSDRVPNPVAVRYAWSNNPDVNTVDEQGLPLAPFRTDDWRMRTAGRR